MTEQQIREIRQRIINRDPTKLRDRLLAIFEAFPDGLTASQAYRIDSIYFQSMNPESSIRARCSEMADIGGPLEMTAKKRIGKYNKPEHYYKLRKL